ncbi:MAG: glycosyltransferase [Flavobacteriales bacterium]
MELWLFTRQFPTGSGEAFLESALPVWARQFDRVRVIPMFEGKTSVTLPSNVDLVRLWDDPFVPLSVGGTLARSASVLRTMSRNQGGGTIALPEMFSHARQLLRKAQVVQARLMPSYDPARVVLLSAWMEDWVSVLGLVKEQVPQLRFATLAHGWDLFEHRRPGGVIPYRRYHMRQLDRVICIATSGRDHLREQYPASAENIVLGHLGTTDHGPAPWSPDATLRLVSCSHLRAPKRLDVIAEALLRVKRPVHWTHLGDGPLRAALEELVRQCSANVRVALKGNVSNEDVLRWYHTHPVDLFVHASAKEGLPVALMEAASFGIPLVANDVGGVREVVTERSGVLLPAEAGPAEWAAFIDGPHVEPMRTPAFREQVRAFWMDSFNAERNYRHIGSLLTDPGGPTG